MRNSRKGLICHPQYRIKICGRTNIILILSIIAQQQQQHRQMQYYTHRPRHSHHNPNPIQWSTQEWHTPNKLTVDHQFHYQTRHPATAEQFRKKCHHDDNEREEELRTKLKKRDDMIGFYREEAARREERHVEQIQWLRKEKGGCAHKMRKVLQQLRTSNQKLSQECEEMKHSLSYSAIRENTSYDENDMGNYFQK